MNPHWRTARKRLQMGQYLVEIRPNGGVIVCPVTKREWDASDGIIGTFGGSGRPSFKAKSPGLYLLKVDQHGRISDITGMTKDESKAMIRIMGAI